MYADSRKFYMKLTGSIQEAIIQKDENHLFPRRQRSKTSQQHDWSLACVRTTNVSYLRVQNLE